MARYVAHGGQCCGAGHIYGFSASDEQNVRDLEREINRVPRGRLTEIILNDNQCRRNPLLLQRMADFGFVYVGRWVNNNHGSYVNCFHRADRRHRLDIVDWNWPGQVIQPTMHGNLPALPLFPHPVDLRNPPRFLPGDIVRIVSRRSRYFGQQCRVRRMAWDGWGGFTVVLETLLERQYVTTINIRNVVLEERTNQQAQPEAPRQPEVPPQVHQIA